MAVTHNLSYRTKDQTRVILDLVGPGDRERLLNGFARISVRTNINRFHTYKKGFTEEELRYLLVMDNVNRLAIGAIECTNPELGIGIARYTRLDKDPLMAEAAIIVIDEYQNKGLGFILYDELLHRAAANGISRLLNIVGKDNRVMLGLLSKFSAHKTAEHDRVYELVVDLPGNPHKPNSRREPELETGLKLLPTSAMQQGGQGRV